MFNYLSETENESISFSKKQKHTKAQVPVENTIQTSTVSFCSQLQT